MKNIILFVVFTVGMFASVNAQSFWVYKTPIKDVTQSMWDIYDQDDKDYFWNKANKLAKLGLMVNRNKLISFETDKSTIPNIDEFRDVVMEAPTPKKTKTDYRITIITPCGTKYDKERIGIPINARRTKKSTYKSGGYDWVTYDYEYQGKYYSYTLGNCKYEIVSQFTSD